MPPRIVSPAEPRRSHGGGERLEPLAVDDGEFEAHPQPQLTLVTPFDDDEQTVVPKLLATLLTRGGWPFVLQSVVAAFGAFTVADTSFGLGPSEGRGWLSLLGRLEAHLRSALDQQAAVTCVAAAL